MIFLDTSFLIAYYNVRDENHSKALNIMERILKNKRNLFISDYIFDELVTVALWKLKRLKEATLIGKDTRNFTKLLKVDGETFETSWNLFKDQKNTKLSFTDCTILSLMSRLGIRDLVTFDKDFSKIEGINTLK